VPEEPADIVVTPVVSGRTEGHVRYVSMDRPDARNALSDALKRALVAELEEFDRDDALRVMVLSGCDCGAFSAGGDLRRVHDRLSRGLPIANADVPDLFACLTRRTKPIIAAVDGFALGGGFELALACDMRIATERSRFGMPEPRVGLLGQYGLDHLSRAIPLGEALRLQLTGGEIDGPRAHTIGLVQELADDREELFAKAAALAGQVVRCSPAAVRSIRHVVTVGRNLPAEYAEQFSQLYRDTVHASAEAFEGVSAFLERREPRWVLDQR
jgi:enoyl-CoA hydratase/carnithine racemase